MSNVITLTGRRAATVRLREYLIAQGAVTDEYRAYLAEEHDALVVDFVTGRVLDAEEGDQ
ncbi:MAG: hypothetical protein ACRDUX_35730 [Mycobacterium sp.]